MSLISLWPPAASSHAQAVDQLVLAFTVLTVALTAPVFILIFTFAVRYRRGSKADRSHARSGSVPIEASWAILPFLMALGFFVWGAWLFFDLGEPPAEALTINVVGRQWMWKFEHPGGQREINTLHAPAGRPVRLNMTSEDVIHSLFVPALRIKQDVLPGRYTGLWFEADRPGTYALRCAEFCGFDHSVMGGHIVIMAPGEYAQWLEQAGTDGSLAAQGFTLFRDLGCSGCHGPQSTRRAPSLAGVYGRPTPLNDGRVVRADEQYLRDSILLPSRDVAAGYRDIMPSFEDQVSEAQLLRLVAYLKSLGTEGAPDEP